MGVEINYDDENAKPENAPTGAAQQRTEPETFTSPVDPTPTGAVEQAGPMTHTQEGVRPATPEELGAAVEEPEPNA
jgi:hypothetical protein